MIQNQNPQPLNNKIILSTKAIHQLQQLMQQDKHPETLMLRIIVEGGGCAGFQYNFKLDHKSQKDDHIFEQDGTRIVVDDLSLEFVKGSEVDFIEQLIGTSFVIRNPNASSACGCGNSFSI
jgi:iron-sulfur cluster insertion protein